MNENQMTSTQFRVMMGSFAAATAIGAAILIRREFKKSKNVRVILIDEHAQSLAERAAELRK